MFGGVQLRREAALVAEADRQACGAEPRPQRSVDFGAGAQRLGEVGHADRTDHELLGLERVGGVTAPVDHVETGHRQPGLHPDRCEPLMQGQLVGGGHRPRRGHRHTDDRVGAEAPLGVSAVEVAQRPVEVGQALKRPAVERRGDLAVDVRHGAEHALATEPAGVAVSKFDRFA